MIYTFRTSVVGCKVNQIELEDFSYALGEKGFKQVKEGVADFALLNSCTVTAKADQKSLANIRRLKKECRFVIVTGCYTQLTDSFPGDIKPDLIISQKDKSILPQLIFSFFEKQGEKLPELQKGNTSVFKSLHTRSFIKIQDGCNNFCKYCRVPLARGIPVSLSWETIKSKIDIIDKKNLPEIVLSGINIGLYNYNELNLSGLINKILNYLQNTTLIRISSIEPPTLTDDLIAIYKNTHLSPHLHIPLQSGSDKILKLMGRRYSVKDFCNKLDKIYKIDKNFAISTDIIVGYPDENEKDFMESYNLLQKYPFMKVHVFPFSARPGTAAWGIPLTENGSVIKKRAKKLLDLSNKLSGDFQKKMIGVTDNLIIEEINGRECSKVKEFFKNDNQDIAFGTSGRYLKGYLLANKDKLKKGDIIKVTLKSLEPLLFEKSIDSI